MLLLVLGILDSLFLFRSFSVNLIFIYGTIDVRTCKRISWPIQKGSQKPLNEDNIIRFLSEQDKINSPYFLPFLITTLLFLMHLFKGYSHESDMPVESLRITCLVPLIKHLISGTSTTSWPRSGPRSTLCRGHAPTCIQFIIFIQALWLYISR